MLNIEYKVKLNRNLIDKSATALLTHALKRKM